jgi:hypothetical protein
VFLRRDTHDPLARRGTILACLLLGCGPVTATSVIDDADRALVRARGTDADKYALYETTLADLYLAKAREKQGHAQYGDARVLAEDALRYANAAGRKATERRASEAVQNPAVPKK